MARKGLNSLVILMTWLIWKLRNRCIFDGCQPRPTGPASNLVEDGKGKSARGAVAVRRVCGSSILQGRDCNRN
ncbi:hypothetical protein PVAP13_5KG570914 [Panicum virgatum]|uniref:Secreted protein n=1 Tax=Panicum virgatum TaxID=38727 RepID=A0A8T0SSQ1_PANVG|nr:hypothetical protein PVAP13_5KG570914 [Panicum virgatum]